MAWLIERNPAYTGEVRDDANSYRVQLKEDAEARTQLMNLEFTYAETEMMLNEKQRVEAQ